MAHSIDEKTKEKKHIQRKTQDDQVATKTMAPPPFSLTSSPIQAKGLGENQGKDEKKDLSQTQEGPVTQQKTTTAAHAQPVQRQEAASNDVSIQSGELTRLGEGSGASTRYIHWPHTDASGVTLGQGYDIGNRTEAQVISELTAAGMSESQATKISKGAGLKGNAANQFVQNNKDDIGEIPVAVQTTLLSQMLVEYTQKAKDRATSTNAAGSGVNAAAREQKDGVEAGTYVLSAAQWDNLHPAMVEFITDLIYQGGYYGWDRVAQINQRLIENDGNHLEQFKAVRELFTGDYMDDYSERIGLSRSRQGAKETFFGQEMDLGGEFRRNQLRLAFLNHVISSMEGGKNVVISKGTEGSSENAQETVQTPQLENSDAKDQAEQEQQSSPSTTEYTVQSGESLWVLSRKFNVSIEDIKTWNADKLKTWGSVQGFNAGETIIIHTNATSTASPREEVAPTSQPAPAAEPQQQSQPSADPGIDYTGLAETVYEGFFGSAFFGLGTDEQAVYTALASLNKDQSKIDSFMQAYQTKYRRDLVSDIKSEFSNNWLFGNQLDKALDYLNLGPLAQKAKKEASPTAPPAQESGTTTPAPSAEPKQEAPASKTESGGPEGDYSRFSYDSQRDNATKQSGNFTKYTGEINGDNMCNVTTLAMMLRSMATDDAQLNGAAADLLLDKGYSGNKEDIVKMQLEDILLKIFIQLGDKYFQDNVGITPNSDFGPHQYASGLNHVAGMFTEYIGRAEHYGAATNNKTGTVDKDAFKDTLKPALDKGGSIMLSTKLTSGHIVMLVDVLDDGILINDPYGMRMPGGYVRNGETVKWRKKRIQDAGQTYTDRLKNNSSLKEEVDQLLEDPGEKTFGQNLGELNFYSWDEISTYRIGKWVNILHAKQ